MKLFYLSFIEIASQIPSEGTGCGTIALKAIKSGDTRVTVRYDKYSATIDVSAFPSLKVGVLYH